MTDGRRRGRVAALALLAALVLLAPAPPAHAYRIGGRAWPYATISYRAAASAYAPAVDRAARLVNRAGVDVRLQRAGSVAGANVVFRYGGARCAGATRIGFRGRRTQSVVALGAGCGHRLIALVAVHEFGHVLGLDHESWSCARMNPTFDRNGTPDRCREHSIRYWLAHPLTADDLSGLRALYR